MAKGNKKGKNHKKPPWMVVAKNTFQDLFESMPPTPAITGTFDHDTIHDLRAGLAVDVSTMHGPDCRYGHGPTAYAVSDVRNNQGNAGRPYFVCSVCPRGVGFATWADAYGITAANPACRCGHPSRESRKKGYNRVETPFWTCAAGMCSFNMDNNSKKKNYKKNK